MPTALVVDRHRNATSARALEGGRQGLFVLTAGDAADALRLVRTNPVDIVLLGIDSGRIDGMELVQAIRLLRPSLPIVVMVASEDHEQITQALQLGATSFVPRRHVGRDLARTVYRLLSLTRVQRQEVRLIENLSHTECGFELGNDPELVQPMVHYLLREVGRMAWCEHTVLVRMGVALDEAISNAILHGNLEVSKDLREEGDRAFRREVAERQQSEPYRGRRVRICCRVSRRDAQFDIGDDGPGFDPEAVLARARRHADRADQFSGRGLLLIQTLMDEVSYNERGNEVKMVKRRDPLRTPGQPAALAHAG